MIKINFNIKEYRAIKGVTAQEMSHDIGISRSYLTNIENNRVDNISLILGIKIAKYFDIDINSIYFDVTSGGG